MTLNSAMRLASIVTAINVVVASGFAILGVVRPQLLVTASFTPSDGSLILALYAAARTLPLALFALAAIYKQARFPLLILGTLAGVMQLLDAGIGLFELDPGKGGGPLFIAVLEFIAMFQLYRAVRSAPQSKLG